MKKLSLLFLILSSLTVFAHDEGHGPAIKDESMYGGKVAAIINAKDVKKGRKAKMLYKGELVHDSKKLEVKLYLYDKNMKAIDLKTFAKTVNGVQLERRSSNKFELKLDESGKFYIGKRPKNKRVPFNIDIKVVKDKVTLFGAFDGLD